MYIHEAVQRATEIGGHITRPDYRGVIITPTNTRDCCRITAKNQPSAPRWEPTAEDLMADDWMVTRVEGIEWPEPAPTPIKRTWMRFLKGR